MRYQSRLQSITIYINPLVPYKAPIIVEEDNLDINRDRGFKGVYRIRELIEEPPIRDQFRAFSNAGNNGSIQPMLPLTDYLLDPNSSDKLGKKDYINQVADNANSYSVSNSDNGPSNKQIYQVEYATKD